MQDSVSLQGWIVCVNHPFMVSPPSKPTLMQNCMAIAQYTPPSPDLPFVARHQTILAMAISCKGQVGLYKILFDFEAFVHN